jgi:signal transduction histidine kinase
MNVEHDRGVSGSAVRAESTRTAVASTDDASETGRILGTNVSLRGIENGPPAGIWWKRAALWLLPPLLCVLAALVASARGGMMINNGVATPIPWNDRFIGALYEFGWWLPVGLLSVLVLRRLSAWSTSTAMRAAAHLAILAGACTLYYFLRAYIRLPGDTFWLGRDWRGFKSVLPSSVGMYLIIASTSELWFALVRARRREREAAELALRASRLEMQLVEAQLGVLRAQLHPHFLFNALHAVSALIDWRPKEARRMLTQLSELLRMALDFSEHREISVAREMEWLDHYVELQGLRFGDRLAVDIRVVGDAAMAMVPPLVLQPLVENAIKHGIEPRQETGRIEIVAEHDGPWLRLRVRDDGPGLATSMRTGVGLKNTRDRLRTLYGEEQQVLLRERDGSDTGTEAMIELPWKSAAMRELQAGSAG